MTAAEYIRQKGFEHRIQSGQIVLKSCPFCGDGKGHFYIDPDEGAFFCHKCNERGNLITLQKLLGDYERQRGTRYMSQEPQGTVNKAFSDQGERSIVLGGKESVEDHERLLNDPDALAYITETRGISIETAKHFKIGLNVERDGGRWLSIPHYEGGKLVNVKYRSLPPAKKTFRRISGCRSVLFNADALKDQEEVSLTEGELDAITLWDQGIKNVVATTTGAGSFDPEWIDQLETVNKIFLCYDPDEPGQKGAREVARRLGYERCFNVALPDGRDVNDFFREVAKSGSGHGEFSRMVSEAR